ncbi:hypothetical protein F53441_14208 [Fusarium austroafricanum]|uniref:Apple domain-containing protein n=1 Tax=Fusarium austroafricanum TaxID=2364996 RepID=A0A8H4NEB4_9HYPO|nr:hypothetical protein F53441_14208 [Fusarium austroafricanum]
MVNSKRIVAALAYLSIAGHCRFGYFRADSIWINFLLTSVAESSTKIVSSETGSTTEPASSQATSSASQATSSATESEISSAPTTTGASTTEFASTMTTATTTAAATTTTAAAGPSCNNQIYRGQALTRGYKDTQASTEQECWEDCVNENMCNSWFFQTSGACHLYEQLLGSVLAPSNENGFLMGSRDCSPRDYTPCNDNIGFGYITSNPDSQTPRVRLERDCAQLCMKNGQCDVWQYDGLTQTCNMFSGSFSDLVTLAADAPQGQQGQLRLAGSRSCSSDLFKPQLGPCNGEIAWNNSPLGNYRSFAEYNTIALCARACSIDPACLAWTLWTNQCDFSETGFERDSTDIEVVGSRNCGVP